MCVFIEQSAKMHCPRLGFSEVSDVYCFIKNILKWDGLLNTLHVSGSACHPVSTLRHQQVHPLLLLCPLLLGVAVQWKRHVMFWCHQDQLWLYGPPDVRVGVSRGLRVMLWEPVPWKSEPVWSSGPSVNIGRGAQEDCLALLSPVFSSRKGRHDHLSGCCEDWWEN